MRKTQSNDLAERHGRGTAWERHGMCESAFTVLSCPVIMCELTLQVKSDFSNLRVTRVTSDLSF
jgi:hypothetical protein